MSVARGIAAACALFAALAFSSAAQAAEPAPALLGAVATTTQQVLAPVAQVADAPAPTPPPAGTSVAGVASSVERVTTTISDTVVTARPPADEPVAARPPSAAAPTLIHSLHTATTQTGHRLVETVTARAPAAIVATASAAAAVAPDRAERLVAQNANVGAARRVARSAELRPAEVPRPATIAGARSLLATLTRAGAPITLAQAPGSAIADLVGSFGGLGPIAPSVALLRPLLDPLIEVLDPLLDAVSPRLSGALAPLMGAAPQTLSSIRVQSTSSAGAAAISPVAPRPGVARETANGASPHGPVVRAEAEREQISTSARTAPGTAAGQTTMPTSSEGPPTSHLLRPNAATTRAPLAAQAAGSRATGGGGESPATSGSAGGFGLALALALSILLMWIAPRALRRLRVAGDSLRVAPFQLIPTRPG